MRPTILAALAASWLIACTADVPPTSAGRFEPSGSGRTDEIVAKKPVEPAPTTPATSRDDDAASTDVSPTEPRDAGTPPKPAPTSTCEKARDLGSIVADGEGSTVSAQGKCSEWLKVRALEQSTSIFAATMKLTATLVSPEESDFDLYLYVDTENDAPACTTVTDKSELPISRHDTAHLSWGEQYTADSVPNARTVSIEVRAKDPSKCGSTSWVLLLEGNR